MFKKLFRFLMGLPQDTPQVKNGDHIKLTWLSPARNDPRSRSAYIGMEGFVTEYDSKDGSFILKVCIPNTEIQTSWLIVSRKYKFIALKN